MRVHGAQDMQEVVTLCLRQDPAKRPTAAQLLKHRFFKWTRPVKDAVDELLIGVPGPVQRLTSLTRRTHEAQSRPGYEEGSSLGADNEAASLLAVKVGFCFKSHKLRCKYVSKSGRGPCAKAGGGRSLHLDFQRAAWPCINET